MTTPTKKTRRTKTLSDAMQLDRVPDSARRQAACVLEVLAGVRSPEEAAEALGTSMPTYYNLEARALRGLVHGCTPESPGRKASLERQLREAQERSKALEQEVQRYRALVRTTQRAADMFTAAAPKPATKQAGGARRRRPKKPRVRALRAVEALAPPSSASDRISTEPAPSSNGSEASA